MSNRLHYPYNQLKDQLEDYNCNNENPGIMYCKDYDEYNKYIIENLKTYNVSTVINTLKKQIEANLDFKYENLDKKDNFAIIISKKTYKKYEDKIENILSFYNYYITLTETYYFKVHIYAEPLYAESVDDFVYNKCNGILYHFVKPSSFTGFDTSKKADSIEKSGLRLKTGNYRYFPEKVFCFCSEEPNLLKADDKILKDFFLDIYGQNKYKAKHSLDKLEIFKVDLNKIPHFKPNFYSDSAMNLPENCVFTFTNIPPQCLTRLSKDQVHRFRSKMENIL